MYIWTARFQSQQAQNAFYISHQTFSNNWRKKLSTFCQRSKNKAFHLICFFKCNAAHKFLLDPLAHNTLLFPRILARSFCTKRCFQNMNRRKEQVQHKKVMLYNSNASTTDHHLAFLNTSLAESEDASSNCILLCHKEYHKS